MKTVTIRKQPSETTLSAMKKTLQHRTNYTTEAAMASEASMRGVFDIPTRITNANSAGIYDGAELRRTCHRPGAYDAFDKPSIMRERVVFPTHVRG